MTRFVLEKRHVNPHQRCIRWPDGKAQCRSMTNYVCAACDAPICGRHEETHAIVCAGRKK